MTNIIAIVLCAILHVESSGGTNLQSGDDGRAVGPYQMWVCSVAEANRIEGIYSRRYERESRVWKSSDRSDLKKSTDMAELILIWHYRRGVTNAVELACRWNRPDGKASDRYRNKIKKILKTIRL